MMNPILAVISAFIRNNTRFLLMGGQACVLYGGSEFTRDSDFCILCSADNLDRVAAALRELQAQPVFFPPLEAHFLEKGHACHFICKSPDAEGFRIDIMSKMRGCPPFSALWQPRNILRIDTLEIPSLSLAHLILAKKTQRDKDWPMIRRLIENDYATRKNPSTEDIRLWLRECRTPGVLIDLGKRFPDLMAAQLPARPLLRLALSADEDALDDALIDEEKEERRKDREYWRPLKEELERMRHERS
jgi:hypothetical protein